MRTYHVVAENNKKTCTVCCGNAAKTRAREGQFPLYNGVAGNGWWWRPDGRQEQNVLAWSFAFVLFNSDGNTMWLKIRLQFRTEMGRSRNERSWESEWSLFSREEFPRIVYCCTLALRCRPILYIFCLTFLFFNDWCPVFCRAVLLLFDCLHLDFIVLLCVFGNGTGITQWESRSNGNKI